MKKLPKFRRDKEAEDFVARADLTEYDLSNMRKVQFDLQLRKQVLPVVDAMKADLKRGIPAKKAFAAVRLRHATKTKATNKK
jgi:hypothetical protein